jgi:hypothetical protein
MPKDADIALDEKSSRMIKKLVKKLRNSTNNPDQMVD